MLTASRSGGKSGAKPKNCVKCEGKGWTMMTTPVSVVLYNSIFPPEIHTRWADLSLGNKGFSAKIVKAKGLEYEKKIGTCIPDGRYVSFSQL